MTFYGFARGVVKTVLTPLYRVRVYGIEHFPKTGGVLLCSNHISELDPPVVGMTAPRTVHFIAKEELFKMPVLKAILPHVNAIPIKRGMSDRNALRKGLGVLKDGNVLGLFPEGTRSKTGELGEGLAGAGFFALRTDAAVVPCAVIGNYKPFRTTKVIFGAPIDMEELRGRKASAEEVTKVIMAEIKDLIVKNR
ncbi:lysophospholipid acyltransferase family protein [Pradoshia sp.]